MNNFFKALVIISLYSASASAKNCTEISSHYGNNMQYQDAYCVFFIESKKVDSSTYRNVTLTDDGSIVFFSNFPGTVKSNSTGARVFHIFPIKGEKEILAVDTTQLKIKHSSGVQFHFDADGKVTSPDLQMKVANEINSENKGGVEIESYSKGIVIDIGYRMGINGPAMNKSGTVTVTDKNQKKCSFSNSEYHKIEKYKATQIYKTNESLHQFLKGKCPDLDISDLQNQPA